MFEDLKTMNNILCTANKQACLVHGFELDYRFDAQKNIQNINNNNNNLFITHIITSYGTCGVTQKKENEIHRK